MDRDEDHESISRRAFLRRIRRGGLYAREQDSATDSSESSTLSPREARRALEEMGVTVLPVSSGDDQLQVQCKRVGDEFGDDDMGLLEAIVSQIAWLDLASTGISDDAIEVIGGMVELRRLYLQNTALTGSSFGHLCELPKLEYLNLFGTRVDDAALSHVAEIDSLRTVYLWQTEVTEDGARKLRERRPEITVEYGGASFDD